ncbi:MAG: hypothetical protein H0X34_14305 [Chthoniobacterales bacterium]|nr:hypothetical protein [Chthoniobacterales bacterium]
MSDSTPGRISSSLMRAGAVLHRNRVTVGRLIYCGIAGWIFVWATITRFALPLDPLADPDVAGYLGPALSKLNGGPFTHVGGLNFLYPGALFLILGAVRDFRAIVVVQHLLGLSAGGFFLMAWNRLHSLSPTRRIGRIPHQAIGLLGAAILLLSNQPVLLELGLRSDAVCLFFQSLTLWLTLEFFHSRLILREGSRAVTYGCAAVASAWLLTSLKPSFLLFAILTIGIVSVIMSGLRKPRLQLVFGVTSLAIILAIVLPDQFLRRSDPTSRRFLTATLFTVHAKLIHTQIEKDLQSGETGEYSPAWLRRVARELEQKLAQTHARYPMQFRSLGFQPDWVLNGPDGLFAPWAQELGGEEPLLKFLRCYYWRALLHQPWAFVRKVAFQMSIFYRRPVPAFSTHRTLPLAPTYYLQSRAALGRPSMLAMLRVQDFSRAYLSRIDALSRSVSSIRENDGIYRLNIRLAQGYCLVCLTGGLVALWLLFHRTGSPGSIAAPLLTIFLCLPNLANTFGIAVIHTMDVGRYSQVQFGAALFVELWILRWLVDLVLSTTTRFPMWTSAARIPPIPRGLAPK